ncbi:MAG TPA: carboxylesterase family protein [Candidatus Acidoferrales bacterium]|nr:carboxylesterase family protein [Candidatus Acidoferrales bacterium]
MSSHQKRQLKLMVLVLAVAVILCSIPGDLKAQTHNNPLAFTFDGPVRGTVSAAGVREFLGIPYAAPPVGNLRWRPPVPRAPWFQTLDTTHFANHCPQPASPFGIESTTEDCLFLNVFTPDSNDFRLRPVMVWIHGGALVTGESNDYDPTVMVQDGVIVVTINYRLGALGFLAHPALASNPTSAGDYGLMDQQLALRWVRDNIVFFGGDPLNVTIFGESAGGLSVFSQLTSPSAANLFQKAIVESGAYALTTQTLATAEAAGTTFATAAGCSSQTAACLRALPVSTILANENPAGYTPNIDGEFLPLSLGAALATGQFHHVPVIQGGNHDEWRLFVALDFDFVTGPIPNTETGYEGALATLVGPAAPIVAAEYPLASFPSADLAFGAAGTDVVFACPALSADLSMSQFVPLSTYEFNDENAPEDFLPPASFPYGAAHASELQYLFNLPITVPRPPLNAQQLELSSTMQHYWTNFAKFGTPNSSGVPAWLEFSPIALNFQSLIPPSPVEETNFATAHKCAFWAALLAAQ